MHANAFGVGMSAGNVDALTKYVNDKLKDCNFEKDYKVDFIWEANDFTSKDVIKIAELNSIYGQGIERPLIAIKNIRISKDNLSIAGKGTLKIKLPNGVELIQFNTDVEFFNEILEKCEETNFFIDVVGTCEINEWMGKVSGQIKVEEYEVNEINNWLAYF